jgi:hypothetical protein
MKSNEVLMTRKPVDVKSTKGRKAAVAELKRRGALSIEPDNNLSRRIALCIKNSMGKEVKLILKSKTSITWQGTIADGNLDRIKPNTFWLFVDLLTRKPRFFIVPDNELRKNIKKTHKEYLDFHNGVRPINEKSTPHAIAEERISKWENKWELLGL